MKLAVFGATGRTGQHLVEQALRAGHEVVALARTPSKITIQNPKLTLVQGDIQDAKRVEEVITGVDAVISVLGPTSNKPEFAVSKGIDNILAVMKKVGVRRLILSAGAGIADPADEPKPINRFIGLLLKLVAKNVYEDMLCVVEKVRASDLDWTIVRVPMLTDDPKKGSLRVGYVGKGTGARLSRADMADFMLKQLQDSSYLRKSPAISN